MSKKLMKSITVLALLLVVASGCGSKNYEMSKTIVYRDQIYQVTDVKSIQTSIEAVISEENTVDLKNRDKGAIDDLIGENDPLFVRMTFLLDDQPMIYRASNVSSYRDYNRMKSDFERAGKDIAKLMASKKTDQLKLR